MEQRPQPPHGGEEQPVVNSYGTDDPEAQAHIENARVDASRERTRNREQLGRMAAAGIDPDDAEALIEFGQASAEVHGYSPPATAEAEQARWNERDRQETPRVYVSDLAAHEAGLIHGRWIDATDSLTDVQEQVVALLSASPVPKPDRWAIDETRGFHGYQVLPDTPLDVVTTIATNIRRHGPAYAVWLDAISSDVELLDKFSDFHVGSYDNLEAWAHAVGEDLEWNSHLDQVVDPMLRPHLKIDYDSFSQTARRHWDVVDGDDGRVHVFLR